MIAVSLSTISTSRNAECRFAQARDTPGPDVHRSQNAEAEVVDDVRIRAALQEVFNKRGAAGQARLDQGTATVVRLVIDVSAQLDDQANEAFIEAGPRARVIASMTTDSSSFTELTSAPRSTSSLIRCSEGACEASSRIKALSRSFSRQRCSVIWQRLTA